MEGQRARFWCCPPAHDLPRLLIISSPLQDGGSQVARHRSLLSTATSQCVRVVHVLINVACGLRLYLCRKSCIVKAGDDILDDQSSSSDRLWRCHGRVWLGVSGLAGPGVRFEKGSVGVDIAEQYVSSADWE